jgi:hypothetical protein
MKVNFSMTKEQIFEFRRIAESNSAVFNQNEIFKICKPASYMVYYLKEINEYIDRLEQGDLARLNEVKKLRKELHVLNRDEAKYSKYL